MKTINILPAGPAVMTTRPATRTLLAEISFIFIAMVIATWSGIVIASAQTTPKTAAATTTQFNPATPKLVRMADIKSGGLLLHSKTPGQYVEAPRLQTDVEINITGLISRTIITQRFENPSDGWVEGIYVFPMPDNAAVDSLKMQIGTRFIEGKIKERIEAKKIYEQAKRDGKKASLVEQQRPNMFTNSIANIGPGETVIVQIEYQETVAQSKGIFSLRVPLVAAPRYLPKPVVHSVSFDGATGMGQVSYVDPVANRKNITPPVANPNDGPINPVTLTVNLDAGFPIDNLVSPYHLVTVTPQDDKSATITLAKENVPANKDFALFWQAAAGTTPTAALFRETVGSEEYLLAIVTPPRQSKTSEKAQTKIPREIIFVIDNSGSMAGESIRQARLSLVQALGRLTPADKFNVIRFDNTMELVFPTAVRADKENLDTAKNFVKALTADGGTEMLPALKASLVDANPNDTSYLRQVIFLTDGAIGNETQLFEEITRNRGRSRIFTVGIGSAPNSYFMSRAAEYGRGSFTHIGTLSEVAARMTELFEKLENPVMTNLAANWKGVNVKEVTPTTLSDLYAGEPIIVAAKMEKVTGELLLTGTLSGKPWLITLPLDKAATGKGIGKLWARSKIRSLEGRRLRAADWKQFDGEILQTALTHHLVSRLTSLIAVDLTPSRPQGEVLNSRELPVSLPEGWNFDKIFGNEYPAVRKASLEQKDTVQAKQFARLVSSNPVAPSLRKVQSKPKGVALPKGATLADHKILMGMLILFLAMATFLAGFLWRYLAISYGSSNTGNNYYGN